MAAISALKVENWSLFFKYRINRAIKQKEKKKREGEEMERRKRLKTKESSQPWFFDNF